MSNVDDQYIPASSPSSSPPSSPSFDPLDSSPPSSPNLEAVATPPQSPEVVHPFAASTKATRRPHLHEKRTRVSQWASNSLSRGGSFESHDLDERAGNVPQVVDPFAASAKHYWKPPRREKKLSRVQSTGSAYSDSTIIDHDDPFFVLHPSAHDNHSVLSDDNNMNKNSQSLTAEERELDIWEVAIAAAVDRSNGDINLSQSGLFGTPLTIIPPSIADLAKLVVLPEDESGDRRRPVPSPPPMTRTFTRAVTVPDAVFSHPPAFGPNTGRIGGLSKTASSSYLQGTAEPRRHGIQLNLARNTIPKLPLELFLLSGLTMLNMHANALRVIPPQIAKLTNLCELDVSQNRLEWLPAEMLKMRLNRLSVRGNPWKVPTAEEQETGNKSGKRLISHTTSCFDIPHLTEYSLRTLLAPVESMGGVTALEALYAIPLLEGEHPPSVLNTLRACVPNAVAKPPPPEPKPSQPPPKVQRVSHTDDVHSRLHIRHREIQVQEKGKEQDKETPPGIGLCPAPAHRAQGASAAVFVQHAVERFTWELVVAGLDVGTQGNKMGVPVRWRGCGTDCLGFLEDEGGGGGIEDVAMGTEVDVEMVDTDVDMEE
ncbi:hypothetical protein BKA93DRAFT_806144 [Sparassis latifolia]